MQDSKVCKTFVRPDRTAVLTCPHCGHQKVILADSFMGRKNGFKAKCVCQIVFTVILEFRKRVRKQVNLRGTYINHSQNDRSGQIIIQDISVSGFGLAFSSLDVKNFQVGDELSIEITLDDEHRTEIMKEAIVRGVRPNGIGCEFEGANESFGSPLGYYVMSK